MEVRNFNYKTVTVKIQKTMSVCLLLRPNILLTIGFDYIAAVVLLMMGANSTQNM
jgi:hypothetical protein